jgi:hypothetical protein
MHIRMTASGEAAQAAPKGNAQQTLRQKGPTPDEASESRGLCGTDEAIPQAAPAVLRKNLSGSNTGRAILIRASRFSFSKSQSKQNIGGSKNESAERPQIHRVP